MKKTLLFLLVCWTFGLYGQSQKGFQDNHQSHKTDQHINIPGTRYFIVPPEGFNIATSHVGLSKEDLGIILVMDITDQSFESSTKGLNRENLESQGALIEGFKDFTFNGFQAKYLLTQADLSSKSAILILGDDTFASMVVGSFSPSEEQIGEEIITALQNIYYDKDFIVDPLAAAAFTLDESQSIFKFHKSQAGIFIYSVDGKEIDHDAHDPQVLVVLVPKAPEINQESVIELALNSLEKYGLTDKKIEDTYYEDVNGNTAYITEVTGEMNGVETFLYLMVLEDRDRYFIIQGHVKSDFEFNLAEIKKLIQTFTLK